jgi:pimeloyl-ACP methyl ester carboxylesterase
MLKAALPQARHATVPAAAHLPGMEQPALVNRLVSDFLAEA